MRVQRSRNGQAVMAFTFVCGVGYLCGCSSSLAHRSNFMLDTLQKADMRVVFADPAQATGQVRVVREWRGRCCRSRLINDGAAPARIKEVVLFRAAHSFPPDTGLYGEGFTMLSQTGGALAEPANIGFFTDRDHYKIPQPEGATTVYSLCMLSPPAKDHHLLAFTSCGRFSGAFRLRADSLEVVFDTENLVIGPHETWILEEFTCDAGPDPNALLARLAERINENHPPRRSASIPTGWCSWYCFGPDVTARQIRDQIPVMKREFPALRFVQIDDGYQPAMGDWLDTRPAFGDELASVCRDISDAGLGVGIWVAPFIAEEQSRLFQQHPDWFVRDAQGQPLRSDRVSFGGWRRGPWYVLDGTHPEAQRRLENLFRALRERYRCTYFKLDANFWGALHGGYHFDPKATRIEAYRRGMQAILRGAGDSFILGCNHPMWASLGLIDGQRCSMDIAPSGDGMIKASRECFYRNWQHGRLWLNDPDVVLLANKASQEDRQFRCTVIYATGGLVLAGDDLAALAPPLKNMLGKLLPPNAGAAVFEDMTFRVGRIDLPDGRQAVCLFNWNGQPQNTSCAVFAACQIIDFWSGQDLGIHTERFTVEAMPPYSARLLVCQPVK